jgi:hypothetical protein
MSIVGVLVQRDERVEQGREEEEGKVIWMYG